MHKSAWNGIIDTTTGDGRKVAAIKGHFLDQAGVRSVTADEAIDALTRPLHISEVKYNKRGEPSVQYIGATVTVAYNPDTDTVITTWKTGKNKRNKYGGSK